MVRLALVLLIVELALTPSVGRAQWQLDGNILCTASNKQFVPRGVSDGAGGAIVTWQDLRSANYDIYAQRIDAAGALQWGSAGVAISNAANDQAVPAIVSDGAGGAIVSWYDNRSGISYDIYAQRINAAGIVQWTLNGVALCTAVNTQQDPMMVSDGAGGAIVTWPDLRSGGSNQNIYAQRINAAGAVQWTPDGVELCTASNNQFTPMIVADDAGGAIVSWYDFRSGTNSDIYAQRINAVGAVQWTVNGVALCTAADNQDNPMIASDGAGGAIVTWHDNRNGITFDIYAQRINALGAIPWAVDGVAVCGFADDQVEPVIVADGAGGAIVTWTDYRSGTNSRVFAQRISASGIAQWVADGVALGTGVSVQQSSATVSDGAGGAIATWFDIRSGGAVDVYVQRIVAAGALQWAADGVAVCTAPGDQLQTITSDGAGGAIVTWADTRSGSGAYHTYAQRVEGRYGDWGRPEPVLDAASDNPGDDGGKVVLNWIASGRDVPNQQVIHQYTIWRALDIAAAEGLVASSDASLVDAPVTKFAQPTERVVWRERTPAATYYWELIGSQIAYYDESYSFLASTRQDAVGTDPATHYFRVVAEGSSQFSNWPSNVLGASSVDNLAPSAPTLLTGQRVGANVNLRWNGAVAPDLRDYSVYRATSSGVAPLPLNFLASSEDTVFVDAGAPAGALHYIVTAYDVHANQSAPSNEASVGAITRVDDTPSITALTVLPNRPNPFTGATDLEIGLPTNSDLTIEVYDVAGRRVGLQTFAQQKAGWRKVPFHGRSDTGKSLVNGVYFYRVTANGTSVTNKMVIIGR